MKIIPGNRIGLKFERKIFLLDPIITDFISFISHAHGDHSPFEIVKLPFCTPETQELLKVSNPFFSAISVELNKKIKFDDITVEFLSAGHILGSAQIFIETPEASILYSGDFKVSENLTTLPLEVRNADILITEATYGNPRYIFPQQEKTKEEFVKWVKSEIRKGNEVHVGAYPIGKSQEAIKILNEEGIIPKVTETIRRYSEVYKKFGVKLEFTSEDSEVLIKPIGLIRNKEGVKNCILTGWTLYNEKGIFGFPISDHADFLQILEYVEMVKPKIVYCFHGFEDILCKEIKKRLGIEARPINSFERV